MTKAIATPPGEDTSYVELTQSEIDAKTTEDAAWNAGADDRKADDERAWRDSKLIASDFTQTLDAPLTGQQVADWATYRQELRDMPNLEGFPNTHTRPAEPS